MRNSGNFSFRSPVLLLILLSCALTGAWYLFVTKPHFEESFSQWKLIMALSGSYTRHYHHYNDLLVWQPVFEWLYCINARIPWFPLALFLFSLVSIVLISVSLFRLGKSYSVPLIWLLPLLFFLSALLSVNLLWVHHNRAAFLMCASAIIYFTSTLLLAPQPPKLRMLDALLWFTGGLLLRIEAGTASTLVLLPSAVWIIRRYRAPLIGLIAAASFLMIAVWGVYIFETACSNDFRFRLEPDVEYELMDRMNFVPLSAMKTTADSCRYQAVKNWMLGDVRLNNAPFIRSLINKPPGMVHRWLFFLFPTDSPHQDFLTIQNIFKLLAQNASVYLLLLILAGIAISAARWSASFHLLIFAVMATALIAASFSVNDYNRVVQPLTGVVACWSVLLFFTGIRFHALSSVYKWGGIPIAVFLSVAGCKLHYDNTINARALNASEAAIQARLDHAINHYPERKYIVLAGDYFTAMQTPALSPFLGFADKILLLPEMGQYSNNRSYLETIGKKTGCAGEDFLCRMAFIEKNKRSMLLIARERRLKLYESYMKGVYGFNMRLSDAPREILTDETFFWMP